MAFNDLFPFKNELNKAYQGIISNATHTSEQPAFDELRVRRYAKPMAEIDEFIVEKIDRWIGWFALSEKTAIGGMTTIRAEVSSVILFGFKIIVTFGLFEEKARNGSLITTVNAKAETQIEARGDLGESRRVIRMMLGALDFNFNKDQITEAKYQKRSLDAKGTASAMLEMFNNAELEQTAKSVSAAKATPIEFKKRPAVQTIQIKPSVKREDPFATPATSDNSFQNLGQQSSPATERTPEETRPVKPKITIVTIKKPS
jgi:hypothetical protein